MNEQKKTVLDSKIETQSDTLKKHFKYSEADHISKTERAAFIKKLTSTTRTRASRLNELESLRDHDVVQTVTDVMIDDAFKASSSKEPLFTVAYARKTGAHMLSNGDSDKKITEDLQETVERLGLQRLVTDMLPDFLLWGEYYYRLNVVEGPEGGVQEVIDDVDIQSVLGVYRQGTPEFFLKKGLRETWTITGPLNYAHFLYGMRKERIQVAADHKTTARYIPEQIRTGYSLFAGAIRKLKKLQTMEMASLADDLRRLLAPILVMIGVPSKTSPTDAAAIVQEYKDRLKRTNSLANVDVSDPAAVLALMGEIEVLPNFSDGKGSIETLDLNADGKQMDERIDRLKSTIGMIIGFPTYYLSTTETPSVGKVEALKVNSRYSRKLVALQEATAEGIKAILLADRKARGIEILTDNIEISFKSVVNVDLLDTVEYQVAIIQTLRDMFGALDEMAASETIPLEVDNKKFIDFFDELVAPFASLKGVLKAGKKPSPEEAGNLDNNGY